MRITASGVILLSILLISVLVYAWVENKDPVVEIDSITPANVGTLLVWNATITVTGSVYDGLAIPGVYGGSGINVGQVSVAEIYPTLGAYTQVGSNITTEVQNTTLTTWTTQKMGSWYRVKVYAEDNAANTTTVTKDIQIESNPSGMVGLGGIIGTM